MSPGTVSYTRAGMLRARLITAAAGGGLLVAAVAIWQLGQWGSALGYLGVGVGCVLAAGCLLLLGVYLPASGLAFEHGVQRRFQAVCREKGLAKKDERGRWVYPVAGRLSGNRRSFRLVIRPRHGQSLADWERAAPAFALAYGVSVVQVRHESGGRLTMTVGYQQVDAHEFEHRELPPEAAGGWREYLRSVEVAKIEGGRSFCLPLINSHLLIAGVTGAGKGSVVWSILLRLLPAHRAGVVRFWGFDPKRMELALGREFFGDRYAADADAMVALLERAHAEMLARADSLAGKSRKFDPSPEHPLEVIVVDELGYLVALLPDRKLRDRCETMLSALLVLGRAVGFTVIGALQDPRKETLSFRDLFPTRVAMRLPKGMVDLVLGNGMYEAGAQCDLIPATEADGAGVAFVVDEASMVPVLVRMSWCSDDAIQQAAARLAAPQARRLGAVA